MAIAFKDRDTTAGGTIGATSSNGTPAAVPLPTTVGISAGDILIMPVILKYPPDSAPVGPPTGWSSITGGEGIGGTNPATPTADKGRTLATVYYKVADGSESGTVPVSMTGTLSGRMIAGVILQFSTTGGLDSTNGSNGGLDTVSSASVSVTMGTDADFRTGDLIIFLFAANTDNYTWSAPSLTIPSCTLDTINLFGTGWTTGQDAEAVYGYTTVLSGTSSGAAQLDLTPSGFVAETGSGTGAPEGGAIVVRFREVGGGGGGGTAPQLTGIISMIGISSIAI